MEIPVKDSEQEEVCETCGGEGETWHDAADRRGEHTTVRERCPDCNPAPERDEPEPDDRDI